MWYYRQSRGRSTRLLVETMGDVFDLTSARSSLMSYRDLVASADIVSQDVDSIAESLLSEANKVEGIDLEQESIRPADPEEVWAAGVTYKISEQAREGESTQPEIYMDVYNAERPELFFKATPSRTVGPNEPVGIRGDSTWDIPEPELALVLYYGDIVGYTVGNDMSSRELEGANPLYLPQAKVYKRCCAIGPGIASLGAVADPHDLELSMQIYRDGEAVFDGKTSTAKMVRSCQELVDAYCLHNAVPELSVLLTGTCIVPPDEFTLRPDDEVEIAIESIGTLRNSVVTV